jgi:hypothetical protein
MNSNENGLSKELCEWSRHFDSMLWTMSGIFLGALGGLGIYSVKNYNLWICLAGLLTTTVASFLVASFRAVRRRIHHKMKQELVNLIRTPNGFKQWPAFILLIMLINILWVTLLVIMFRSSFVCGIS